MGEEVGEKEDVKKMFYIESVVCKVMEVFFILGIPEAFSGVELWLSLVYCRIQLCRGQQIAV